MAEEAEATEDKQAPAAAESSGKNPLVTILLVANAALMGAVAYFQYTAHQKELQRPSIRDIVKAEMKISEEGNSEEAETTKTDGFLLPLEGFTANLAQGDGPRRYIRLNAVLKFNKSSNEEEFKTRKPQIRDTIISILNSKRPEDLLKSEGKAYLKEEIKASINSFLVDGHVADVYYIGFQIN